MSRATLIQVLWWLAAWNLGSLIEYVLGGPWTLIGIAAGTLLVLAMRVRSLPRQSTASRPQETQGQA
jgi:hypothetical protein